jgi:hypothetical protein
MSDLANRLSFLKTRLSTAYDGIGHSHGRPYVYFVYPPDQERLIRRLIMEELQSDSSLTFYHLDVFPILTATTVNQEAKREALFRDPLRGKQALDSLERLWARAVSRAITGAVEAERPLARPVIVLTGLAALHPLGTPTSMMEHLAEHEPRDPLTGRVLPVVLFIPGIRPPQTSREYLFLGQERLRQDFYRGEEV